MKERDSIFLRIADAVSYGMGTPANIGLWILAVLAWIGLFAFGFIGTETNILPAWFTSNAFNFPLNTVTTLAELYIGFLVAAAANRSERSLKKIIEDVVDDEKLDLSNEDLIKKLLERIDVEHISPMKEAIDRIETALKPKEG